MGCPGFQAQLEGNRRGIELPEEDRYHGTHCRASPVAQRVKNLPPTWETRFRFLDQEDALEKKMPTHSSIFAQRIMWTEEPGGLQSMGSQRDIL